MIEYIKGELTLLTPAMAVVEASGVGYGLNISLNTFTALQGKKEVKVHVHEVLSAGGRDDSFTLYGFATEEEREFYRLLITVSGVGSNTARMILSTLAPNELRNVIANGDERMLKSVKGIGLRTAQRIILELKDKVLAVESQQSQQQLGAQGVSPAVKETRDEAVGALTMLGFPLAASAKVVNAILSAYADMPVEKVVKEALKQIK